MRMSGIHKNNITYELAFKVPISRAERLEILFNFLLNSGVPQKQIIEVKKNRSELLLLYFPARMKAVNFIERLDKFHLKGITFKLKSLHKRDWQDKWKMDFKPFALTKNLTVIPSWLKRQYKLKRGHAVYVDTSSAFGSGLHETSRFMIRIIEYCSGKFKDFLDVGTGTGILTIAARHCGAKMTLSVDVSADAVKTARINLTSNGYPEAALKVADIKYYQDKKQFDFVAANLITHDLIEFGKKLLSFVKPGQYLAVSGISLENLSRLKKSYAHYPLKCLKILKGRQWTAILYKRLKG